MTFWQKMPERNKMKKEKTDPHYLKTLVGAVEPVLKNTELCPERADRIRVVETMGLSIKSYAPQIIYETEGRASK